MGKPQKPDARGGTFFLLPACLEKSAAWRTASPRAIKALFGVWAHHTGFNNGRIALSLADLAPHMDSQNHGANAKALAELDARGICVAMTDYRRGVRLAREYRLTFVPTASGPATHDYLGWQPGDAGSRRKPVVGGNKAKSGTVETANETGVSIVETARERKLSIADSANEKNGDDGKPPFLEVASFAETAAHITNHLGESSALNLDHGKIGGGHRAPLNGTSILSAAPSADDLRSRALGFIARNGRGSQGALSAAAGIPGGTFSKFLHRGASLNDRSRLLLACAFPRLEEASRKGVAA